MNEGVLGHLNQHPECPQLTNPGTAQDTTLTLSDTLHFSDNLQTLDKYVSASSRSVPYIQLPFGCFQIRRQNTNNDMR